MSQALVDDDLWTRIEPLLPKRQRRNRQHAGRKPIADRAGADRNSVCAPQWDSVEHAADGDGQRQGFESKTPFARRHLRNSLSPPASTLEFVS